MTEDLTEVLNDLADRVADEFEEYRPSDDLKNVSLVVDKEDPAQPTLIVHIDRGDASSLADDIKRFLQVRVHEPNHRCLTRFDSILALR